jgi:virulence plasmid B protein
MMGGMISRLAAYAATLLSIAIFGFLPMGSASWADEFSTSGLGIDGLPTLAGADRSAGSANALADVDPSTGAVRASLSFQLPVARGRAQPSLSLMYSSAVGLGTAGVGWTLNLPSIERKGAAAFPKFIDDPAGTDPASVCSSDVIPPNSKASTCADRFVLAGQALVPVCIIQPPPPAILNRPPSCAGALPGEVFPDSLIGWTYFRAEIDDGNRVFWSPNRETWIVQTHAGVTSYFGRPLDLIPSGPYGHGLELSDALSLAAGPDSSVSDVYRWNLVRQVDESGNVVVFQWDDLAADAKSGVQGMLFLTDIFDTHRSGWPFRGGTTDLAEYAHHTHLRWSTPDASTSAIVQTPIWRAQSALGLIGVDVTSKSAEAQGPRELVRRYHLGYTWNPAHTRPFLTSFQLEGRCPGVVVEDAKGLLPLTTCARQPATTLEYTTPPLVPNVRPKVFSEATFALGPLLMKDVDGDALPELLDAFGEGASAITFVLGGGSTAIGTRMELPRPSPTGRVATENDIQPGAPHAVFGDFVHNNQMNVLFANPGDPAQGVRPSYELYTLVLSPPGEGPAVWVGAGPFDLPAFFLRASLRESAG